MLKRVIATRNVFQQGHVQMLNWARLPAGACFRPHYHQDMQEAFVLVSGRVRMTVADTSVLMEPGDTVIVDPGEIHRMTSEWETDSEYLVFGISAGKNGQTIVVD